MLVPKHALQSGSTWEAEEGGGVWVWPCAGNNFYMDIGEIVRFRVSSVRFNPQPRLSQQVCPVVNGVALPLQCSHVVLDLYWPLSRSQNIDLQQHLRGEAVLLSCGIIYTILLLPCC